MMTPAADSNRHPGIYNNFLHRGRIYDTLIFGSSMPKWQFESNLWRKTMKSKIQILILALALFFCTANYAQAAGNINKAKIEAYQVTLDGQFNLMVQVGVGDAEVAASKDLYMTYTIDGVQKVAETVSRTDSVIFSCELGASQMGDDISMVLCYGEDKVALGTYSIERYLNTIIENKDESDAYLKAQNLAKALLEYGACSQVYFDHNTANLVNQDISNPLSLPSETDIRNAAKYTDEAGQSIAGFTFAGNTLVCTSETKLRFYWENTGKISKSSFDAKYTVAVEGANASDVYYTVDDSYLVVTVADVSSLNYDIPYKVTISDGSNSASVSYSVLNYLSTAMDSAEPLKNLCKSMYLYYLKSENYVSGGVEGYIKFDKVLAKVLIVQENNTDTITIAKVYPVAEATINIPDTICGLTVTAIGEGAFEDNTCVETVYIPDTITVIGARAFKGCSNLKSMNYAY